MRKLILCTAAICLLMTSCQSNNVVTVEKTVVPDIVFPIFPKIKRTVNTDGSWLIPKESADMLAEYYIQIQETEKNYEGLRELYEKDENQ